jgi:drug/metabolite transporter (DMT)-like permease
MLIDIETFVTSDFKGSVAVDSSVMVAFERPKAGSNKGLFAVRGQRTYPMSVWIALISVYLVWGSTYLAIRYAVETIPPFLMAGSRFLISGLLLYLFLIFRGAARPTRVHWRSAAIIGFFLLVVGNGGVTWAEQKVPSGAAALLVGTVPLWMVLLQWLWEKSLRPDWKTWSGLALGLAGIGLLVFAKGSFRSPSIDTFAALLLVGTSLAWSVGSLYARSALLPTSALMATAIEMIAGGSEQFLVALVRGEHIDPQSMSTHSLEAWVYLTLIGSLVGFTSYIWVLQKGTPALASTYAFVNPVIAVFLGWFFAQEAVTPSVFLAAAFIVTAVILITLSSNKKRGERAN